MWTALPTIHLAVADTAPSMVEVEVEVSVDVLGFHGQYVALFHVLALGHF